MAITSNEIETKLDPIIKPSPYVEGEKVIELSTNSGVNVNTFLAMFSEAVDMTANSLHAIDNGNLGYEKYIDDWKAKGYIA